MDAAHQQRRKLRDVERDATVGVAACSTAGQPLVESDGQAAIALWQEAIGYGGAHGERLATKARCVDAARRTRADIHDAMS